MLEMLTCEHVHTEVPVKVTAWIDAGIAPLVKAMNELPDVVTLQSCQGRPGRSAYVYFTTHGGTTADLVETVEHWTAGLGEDANFLFRIEWLPGTKTPLAQLLLPPSQIETVAQRLSGLDRRR